MPAVTSSVMTWIEYDPAGRRLVVTFTSGRRYAYAGVPAHVYEALLAAASKGGFFNGAIRDVYDAVALTGRPGRAR